MGCRRVKFYGAAYKKLLILKRKKIIKNIRAAYGALIFYFYIRRMAL